MPDTTPVIVRMPYAMHARIKKTATKLDLSMAQFIRRAIRNELDRC